MIVDDEFIMCSGIRFMMQWEALLSGASDYVCKPTLNPEELMALLEVWRSLGKNFWTEGFWQRRASTIKIPTSVLRGGEAYVEKI